MSPTAKIRQTSSARPDSERRRAPRTDFRGHVQIDLPGPSKRAPEPLRFEADSLNVSEGGLCVRLHEALEVRSQVRLRLFPERAKRPLECAGRVAWVVQRQDFRSSAAFLYDVGLEFVDPSPRLRDLVARTGIVPKLPASKMKSVVIPSAIINERCYVPKLSRDARPDAAWHLVIWVDEVPCYSQHFASQKSAMQAWEQFKRDTARNAAARLAARNQELARSKPRKRARPAVPKRRRRR